MNIFLGRGRQFDPNTSFTKLNTLSGNLNISNISSTERELEELFQTSSENLIGDLIRHPEHATTYRELGSRLREIDEDFFKKIQSSLGSIQRISLLLRNGNADNLNSFTQNLGRFAQSTTEAFCDLHLPDDLKKIKAIADPDVRTRVLAEIINRDKIPIKTLTLSVQEMKPLAPHLRYLDCRNAFNGWPVNEINGFLDAASNKVEHLFVSNLERLPQHLPNCRTLECNRCGDLQQIPALPQCRTLKCEWCAALEQLPDLPLCLNLNCYMCTALLRLPDLPNCQTLKCSWCTALQQLTDLPLCQTLDCQGCTALQQLPDLPLCQRLDCQGCAALQQLPPLPNCQHLGYARCPNLNPGSIPVRFRLVEGIQGASVLQVRVNDLNNNPLKVLLDLSIPLLRGQSIPKIQYMEEDGRVGEGIDAGGLRRSLVSRLVEGLMTHAESEGQLSFIKEESGLLPVWHSGASGLEDLRKGFRALGALFVQSLTNGYVTGNIFNPALYRMICSLSYEDLAQSPEDPTELSNQIRNGLILVGSIENVAFHKTVLLVQKDPSKLTDGEYETLKEAEAHFQDEDEKIPDLKESSLENKIWVQARLKEKLYTIIKDTQLPAYLIAKQMQMLAGTREQWDQWCSLGPQELQNRIEGVLTPEMFISAIQWDPSPLVDADKVEKTKAFINLWIGESSIEDLRKLAFTITGSNTLSTSTQLKFQLQNRGTERLPEAHTCDSSIDISADYRDYDTFKNKLNRLIAESTEKGRSGFEFA